MKRALLTLAITLLSVDAAYSQTLRIDIKGELFAGSPSRKSSKVDIFHGSLVLPQGRTWEVFAGPYTIKLTADSASKGEYYLSSELLGLGPDFKNVEYNITLAPNDPMLIPPLPVKGDAQVKYTLTLSPDTAAFKSSEPDVNDTTAWGVSESVHYRTHWIRGSLADYTWNPKLAYLEEIYDRYRASFLLSSFEKIDLYFYPDTSAAIFLGPGSVSAIQPRVRRIDVVYGHDFDAATPRLACELLMYKLWGYGPRWMVSGFAGFYDDNLLRLRGYAGKLDTRQLVGRFSDESWVESDTGREVTGGFARWLADTQDIGDFQNLYKQATTLNYQKEFIDIYEKSFESALHEFIDYAKRYQPKEGELGYYAHLYMSHGDYRRAADYFSQMTGEDKQKNLKNYTMCLFWGGDYQAALKSFNLSNPSLLNCDREALLGILKMAAGDTVGIDRMNCPARATASCPQSALECALSLMDQDQTAKASSLIDSLKGEVAGTVDYAMAVGRLRILQGQSGDSVLAQVAAMNLARAQAVPQDPMNYYMAGRAFSLMGQLDKAKENLEISYFLERRPYFIGTTLLELGRVADLNGNRDEAKQYYGQVISMNVGAYQNSLASKYVQKKYVNGH